MKKVLLSLGVMSVAWSVIYLLGAFVAVSWNIADWDSMGRLGTAMIGLLCAVFAPLFVYTEGSV